MLEKLDIKKKTTNSAILLNCDFKEMHLLKKDKNNKMKKIKNNNKDKSLLHQQLLICKKYPKNLLFFEKYAQFCFNYKYSIDENFYYIKVINDIISNESTHVVAEFKDYLLYGDDTEFLHMFYGRLESKNYLPKIFDYYHQCSIIFPNYVVFPENKYLFKNIRKKQKVIDLQQEQDYRKELILKGELDYDDEDEIFTSRDIYNILDQTNTSNIKKFFGIYKNGDINPNEKQDNDNLNNNNNKSIRELVETLEKEIKKYKEKKQIKKIKEELIKRKEILNLKNSTKSKTINNKIDLVINLKGRNSQNDEIRPNYNTKNIKSKNYFYTNINIKNNSIRNNIKNKKFKSNSKSKIKDKEYQNIIMNNYINYKYLNINKAHKNKFINSFITDSKTNHINNSKNNTRIKSKIKNNNTQLKNNSTGKSKKAIQQYFKSKISPKAIIIKMITESNRNKSNSPNSSSKNKFYKKEKSINQKRAVSLTPSLTNKNNHSHKTKKIYNRNGSSNNISNSIVNIKQKNKILENKVNCLNKDNKFKSLIVKESNNNSNYNIDTNLNNNIITNNTTNTQPKDNITTINNNSNNNTITRNEVSLKLYNVNSYTNIQKEKHQYSKIKTNKHNSTLTCTTTCSCMKHSSINNEKKTTKQIKYKHIFYGNEIIIKEPINKRNNKIKCYNLISNQFPNNNIINNISNNNKITFKTENKKKKYFPISNLSPSTSIGNINKKKDLLYKKLIRKRSGILPLKKAFLNLKILGSSFNSRIMQDTSKTKVGKSTIDIDRIYSLYRKKK